MERLAWAMQVCRVRHDCREAGGRVTQEQLPGKPEAARRKGCGYAA